MRYRVHLPELPEGFTTSLETRLSWQASSQSVQRSCSAEKDPPVGRGGRGMGGRGGGGRGERSGRGSGGRLAAEGGARWAGGAGGTAAAGRAAAEGAAGGRAGVSISFEFLISFPPSFCLGRNPIRPRFSLRIFGPRRRRRSNALKNISLEVS